jgi:hypothetical protein
MSVELARELEQVLATRPTLAALSSVTLAIEALPTDNPWLVDVAWLKVTDALALARKFEYVFFKLARFFFFFFFFFFLHFR